MAAVTEMPKTLVRPFRDGEETELSQMIGRTLRKSNAGDYPPEEIERLSAKMSPEALKERAAWTHMYVAERAGRLVGCAAIGPFWGSQTEVSFFNVFVEPDMQGQGVGRSLIEALERDPMFLRAERAEIPASITAVNFYKKFGYTEKPGKRYPDEEGLYRLEKRLRPREV